MPFFKKKRSVDVVDLTDMQRRGLLKTSIPEKNEEGIVDLSSSSSSPAGDFLSSLAGFGANSSVERIHPSPGPIISNLRAARQRGLADTKINELKLKLDDNDYKLNTLIERVKELEDRLKEKRI